jgi:hypothetical protein
MQSNQIHGTQFFSPKNNEALYYFNRFEHANKTIRVVPHILSNNKEIFRLDNQLPPLINGRYILPESFKSPLGDISEVSLAEVWADKFINNQIPEADLEPKAIISQIEKHLRKFVRLSERGYSVISLWIYGTHFYKLFYEYPYLLVKGNNRDVDSTLIKVLRELCFNAKYATYPTADSLAKDISRIGGTFIIQDLTYNKNRHKFNTIISRGHVSESYIRVLDLASKTRPSNAYDIYSPKAFSNISSEYEEMIHDHCIMVSPLAKEAPRLYDHENLRPFRDTASKCCLSSLLHFKKVYNEYQMVPLKHTLEDILRPLIALAKMLGGKYENLFSDI